ncbi:MAG: phosphatase PAP2 family protein [Clostridia bacterium]|nr:phosphatase PAP2 family protein [Clostridia bacterium]
MEVIKFMQKLSNPFFDFIFNFVSFLGEPIVIIGVLCTLYWCVNKKKSEKLIFIIISSMAFNDCVKNMVRKERPWILDESISSLRPDTATGYSFPSGHTQFTATLWPSLMLIFRKKWLYPLGISLMVLMPLSRIYLGAHTFLDVFVGLVMGIVLSFFFYFIYGKIEGKSPFIYLIFLIPALFSVLALLPFWNERPAMTEDTFKIIGLSIGAVFGIIFENKKINFSEKGDLKTNILKSLIGFLGIIIIYGGLKVLFSLPFIPENISEYLGLLRYMAIALFATIGMGTIIKKFFNK